MASTAERPQYYPNNLSPAGLDDQALQNTIDNLRDAIRRGVELIDAHYPPPADGAATNEFGNAFTGALGIAVLHIYRSGNVSFSNPQEKNPTSSDVYMSIRSYVPNALAGSVTLNHGRSSPICDTELGSAFLSLLLSCRQATIQQSPDRDGVKTASSEQAAKLIHEAIQYALQQPPSVAFRGHDMGIDEVLYGRAGLLWAILLLQTYSAASSESSNAQSKDELSALVQRVPALIDAIVSAGSVRSSDDQASLEPPELSWPWLSNFRSLGAMHGTTGILAVLLLAPYSALSVHVAKISHTITALCKLCIEHGGHLPMSVPEFPSKTTRTSPLVQICHGTPGLLLLLACARRNQDFRREHWQDQWDATFKLGSERVWQAGLLSKGSGICHGIAGNALPWLLWAEVDEDHDRAVEENYLGKAIAFLEECKLTPPFHQDNGEKYRTPDHPYSLFEGLAGTVVVWSEAVRIIEKRLGHHAT